MIQAPLIYGYPLKEWMATYSMMQHYSVRVTSGQIRSLRAVGGLFNDVPMEMTSTAIKEVF